MRPRRRGRWSTRTGALTHHDEQRRARGCGWLGSAGAAQEDVDRVAVAGAGGVPPQPIQVLGVATDDLAQGPALVAAEVEAQLRAVGTEGTARSAVSGVIARRRRGSATPGRLPHRALNGVAHHGPRPVEVGHPLLAGLVE